MQNTNDLKLTDQLERELIEREMSEGIYHYRRPSDQSFSFTRFFSAIANLFDVHRTAKVQPAALLLMGVCPSQLYVVPEVSAAPCAGHVSSHPPPHLPGHDRLVPIEGRIPVPCHVCGTRLGCFIPQHRPVPPSRLIAPQLSSRSPMFY